MLKFTDPNINIIDENITKGMLTGVARLSAEYLNPNGRTVTIKRRKLINFALNNALGLEIDPRVKAGIIESVQGYGSGFFMSQDILLHLHRQKNLKVYYVKYLHHILLWLYQRP